WRASALRWMPGVGGAEFALAWREGGGHRRCAGCLELERLSLRLRGGKVVCVGAALDAWSWRG
ncbi:hypothetical protein DW894_10800, partial [Ruminococcus sp. AM41-10BH]